MKVKKILKKCFYGFIAGAIVASATAIDVKAIADKVNWNKAELLVSKMTLEQKAAQMLQPNLSAVTADEVEQYQLGSVLSGGGEPPASGNEMSDWATAINSYQQAAIKGTQSSEHQTAIPLLYGVDAVHGNNNVYGATIFPHNIGLAASQDIDLVEDIGEAVASETIATGANWAFTPSIGVPHNERWGRTYETFGDDYNTVANMGVAYIKGVQSSNQVIATAKHYLGEGLTTNGTNQGNVVMDDETYQALVNVDMSNATVKEILTPYKKAIDSGVSSIMVSYNSINSVKCHGNKDLVNDLLKEELGFKGIVISDYNGVDQITEVSGYAKQVAYAVNAGLDMLMVAGYSGNTAKWKIAYQAIIDGVNNGQIEESRVDDACTRIIAQKYALGIMDNTSKAYASTTDQELFGSDEHRAIARKAVAESLVLLKNTKEENETETAMQKLASAQSVFVAGSNANNLGNQCGGWTISWQGQSGNTCTEGTTIFKGIQDALKANDGKATYNANGYFEGDADFAVVVAGETPYAESNGDSTAGALKLKDSDLNAVKTIKEDHPDLPIILVLVTGRPLTIADQVTDDSIKAIVSAWLPGSEGAGVADVLFGDKDFTGTNPITWPWYAKDIDTKLTDESKVLYKTGYGLKKAEVSEVSENPGDPDIIKFETEGTTKIEAENYSGSYSASDQLKLENNDTTVGNFRVGSYVTYKISTEKDAVYNLVGNLNANADVANAFQILVDDKVILNNTMTVPGQGNWTTFKPLDLGKVSIPAGEHTLKLLAKAKDFNVDWFTFEITDDEYVEPEDPDEPVVDNGSGAVLQEGAVQVTMSSAENSGNDWYDGNKKITNKNTEKDSIDLKTVDNSTITTINVDHTQEYNSFLGMGTSIDESTIHNLWKMDEDTRYQFIKNLVDPVNGSGDTLFRLTIGTPDFVACPFYTYYDGTGTELNGEPDWYNETGKGFTIQKDHDYHIIETVQLIQKATQECGVADQIKFFASPWTPPGWMKEQTNASKSYKNNELLLKGGKLSDDHIDDAAKYYVRYIEEYAKLGIPVYAMTLQNEPMLEIDYPSCAISASQEAKLAAAIKKELKNSTILKDEEKDVKIWAFDHNPGDLNTYMNTVYGAAIDAVDGAAVHDYGGELSNMTTLHNKYDEKSIHLTERSVWGTTGMDRIVQYYRNYAESYNCWVTMLDSNKQTHQWVGTPDVTAFVQDANDPDNYWATPEVYLMNQFSKYIRPGFVRVQSNYGSTSTITNVVFKNPETNELIMVAVNNTDSDQNFRVINNGVQFNAVLPAKNCATYIWNASDAEINASKVPGTIKADECASYENLKVNDDHTLGNLTSGASADYFIDVEEAGTYNVLINVATASADDKEIQLKSGDKVLGRTILRKFTDDNAWFNYKQVQIQVTLEKGIQKIRLSVPGGSVNVKDLSFEKAEYIYDIPGYINATQYSEAEGVVLENGYVGAFDTESWTKMDYISYRINVQKAGTYPMILEYSTNGTDANFWVDKTPLGGEKVGDIAEGHDLPATDNASTFKSYKAMDITFEQSGEYEIKFVPNMNKGFNLKSIAIGANVQVVSDVLKENNLNDKTIYVTLSDGHQFNTKLNTENWLLEGLPEGITYKVERLTDNTVKVVLSGKEVNDYDSNQSVTVKCDAAEIGDEGYTLSGKVTIIAENDDESITDIEIVKGAKSFEVELNGGTFNQTITADDIVLSDSLAKYLSVQSVEINDEGNLTVHVNRKDNYVDITGTVTIKASGYSDGDLDLEANVNLVKNADPDAIVTGKDDDKIIVSQLTADKAYDSNGSLANASNGSYETFYIDVKEAGDYILAFDITNNEEMTGALSINGGLGINSTNNLASISFGKYWNNTNVSYKTLLHFDEVGKYTLQLRANNTLKLTNATLSLKPEAIEINGDYTLAASQIIDGSDDKLWAIESNSNVGYTGVDAYQDYFVNVTNGGKYAFSINYATEGSDSVAELISVVDGKETSLGTVELDSTGSWSTYNDSKAVDVQLPQGTQILRLKIKSGGFNTKTVQLTKDTSEPVEVIKPEITAENDDVKVYVDSEDSVVDLLGIQVKYNGQDVTNDATRVTVETDYNPNEAGKYTVKVIAKDSQGNDVIKEYTITVVNKPTLSYKNDEIVVNSEFDPMADIVVIDTDGTDITDKVTIKENNIDLSKPGTYTIIYSVVGGLNNDTFTFVREVKVVKSIDVQPNPDDNHTNTDNDVNDNTVTVVGTLATGDDMNILPYAMFAGISLLGVLYALKKRRKTQTLK